MAGYTNIQLAFLLTDEAESYFQCTYRTDNLNETFIADKIHATMTRLGVTMTHVNKVPVSHFEYATRVYAGATYAIARSRDLVETIMDDWKHRIDTWVPDPYDL